MSLSCIILSHLTFPIPPRKKRVKLSGLTLKNIFGNKMLHVTQCYSQVLKFFFFIIFLSEVHITQYLLLFSAFFDFFQTANSNLSSLACSLPFIVFWSAGSFFERRNLILTQPVVWKFPEYAQTCIAFSGTAIALRDSERASNSSPQNRKSRLLNVLSAASAQLLVHSDVFPDHQALHTD